MQALLIPKMFTVFCDGVSRDPIIMYLLGDSIEILISYEISFNGHRCRGLLAFFFACELALLA